MSDRESHDIERVGVVIPTWNRKDLLLTCLESVHAQTRLPDEVIVVDDASDDGTPEAVAAAFPSARVIRLDQNSGFAAAANAGIRAAELDALFLLNNDMTLEPNCLEMLVGAMDSAGAGMAAPLVLWRDTPDRIYSAGDAQRVDGRPEAIGHNEPRDGFALPGRIFGVSAGAGLYRREVFDAVGLLDERFEAYFEDSDLSFRARLAGFEAVLAPEAVAYHVGSASLEGRHLWRARLCHRNHMMLVVKNMPFSLLMRHGAAIFGERWHQTRRVFSVAYSEGGALKAFTHCAGAAFDCARCLPHALHERGRIQRSRRIEANALAGLLKPKP